MTKVFYLSGGFADSTGLGDCIYSLPTVKAFGGGTFVYGGAARSHWLLKRLMEVQPYIKACLHISEIDLPRDFINLDHFRNSQILSKAHLVNCFLTYFGFPRYDFSAGGWLEGIEPLAPVATPFSVINVTPRYRDKVFNLFGGWKKEVCWHYKQGSRLVLFLGRKEEHDAVVPGLYRQGMARILRVPHIQTADLFEAAQIIRAAHGFSGTQSALLAIRQGLGLPYRVEQSPNLFDVIQGSDRETVINPFTRKLHLIAVTAKKLAGRGKVTN